MRPRAQRAAPKPGSDHADATLLLILGILGTIGVFIAAGVFLIGSLPSIGTPAHLFLFTRDHGRGTGAFSLTLAAMSAAIAFLCFGWHRRPDAPARLTDRFAWAAAAHTAAAALLAAVGLLALRP